jgi:hypothetical protein
VILCLSVELPKKALNPVELPAQLLGKKWQCVTSWGCVVDWGWGGELETACNSVHARGCI